MQSNTLNETDAEIMYGNFTNVEGATITTGYPVSICTTAASLDGNQAVIPATGQVLTFAGVCEQDIPDTSSGRYIAFGYAASVAIFAVGSSVTTAIDVAMGPAAASLGVNSTGVVDITGPVISMAAIAAAVNSPGGYATGWVRNM